VFEMLFPLYFQSSKGFLCAKRIATENGCQWFLYMSEESFEATFRHFREEFTTERALIVSVSSIIAKASTDLRSGYAELLQSSSLLARMHYMANTPRSFSVEELLLPLRGIQPIALGAVLRLFVKPNHKDRYCMLISYLRENPNIFAQTVYFALLAPSNPTLQIPDVHLF